MAKKQTGMSLDEIAKTEAFKSLGANLQGIMILSLTQRDLHSALKQVCPKWDEATIHKGVLDLLRNENVRKVVNLYAIGESESEPAVDVIPASELAAEVTAETPVTITGSAAEVPTIDCGTFSSDAKADVSESRA